MEYAERIGLSVDRLKLIALDEPLMFGAIRLRLDVATGSAEPDFGRQPACEM